MCLSNTQTSYQQDNFVTAVNEVSIKMVLRNKVKFTICKSYRTFCTNTFLNFEISSKILSLYSRKILGKEEQNVAENQLTVD